MLHALSHISFVFFNINVFKFDKCVKNDSYFTDICLLDDLYGGYCVQKGRGNPLYFLGFQQWLRD